MTLNIHKAEKSIDIFFLEIIKNFNSFGAVVLNPGDFAPHPRGIRQ